MCFGDKYVGTDSKCSTCEYFLIPDPTWCNLLQFQNEESPHYQCCATLKSQLLTTVIEYEVFWRRVFKFYYYRLIVILEIFLLFVLLCCAFRKIHEINGNCKLRASSHMNTAYVAVVSKTMYLAWHILYFCWHVLCLAWHVW